MNTSETFQDVDAATDPAAFAQFLDDAAKLAGVAEIKSESFRALTLAAGETLLDVGAGLGNDLLRGAECVGPKGRVVGVDKSKKLLAIAAQRLGSPSIELQEADANALPFAAETFHACRAERVLLHIQEPERVITEMKRVLHAGGRMVIFELDWATLVVDHPDRKLTGSILHHISERHRNPWLGRSLARLFREAGLVQVQATPMPITLDYPFFLRLLRDAAERVANEGDASAAAVEAWHADMRALHEKGGFLASILGYLARGVKPDTKSRPSDDMAR